MPVNDQIKGTVFKGKAAHIASFPKINSKGQKYLFTQIHIRGITFCCACIDVYKRQPYGRDGETVLREVSLRHLEYEEALERLIGSEAMQDYLKKDALLSITLENRGSSDLLLENLQICVDTTLRKCHSQARTEYVSVDGHMCREAHSLGMSVGKYYAIQELLTTDPQATLDEMCIRDRGYGDCTSYEYCTTHDHGDCDGHWSEEGDWVCPDGNHSYRCSSSAASSPSAASGPSSDSGSRRGHHGGNRQDGQGHHGSHGCGTLRR